MDKNGYGSNKQKTCCEKLYIAVRNTSPFIRTIRFTKQQHREDVVVSPTSSIVSLTAPTNLSDRCVRVSRVDNVAIDASPISLTTTNVKDRCPRISKQSVLAPVVAERKRESDKVAVSTQAKSKATILPIHGHENRLPPMLGGPKSYIAQSINGMSEEYLDRAGRKIRSPTIVPARKPSVARDSFHDRVNDFINRNKNKFHAPSFAEAPEGKEKRLK
ncbi:hypothetical protein BVRB_7g176040 [Beta vulgaris subsp. vulgaris]|nr:hypothetical protein BVRB_7g176040 [Beta vulgaris subsp. vulgaris]